MSKQINVAIQEDCYREQSRRLWHAAEHHVNTLSKLRRRLRQAASVLLPEYRKLFPVDALVDQGNRRLLSIDGKYALQWYNNGQTSTGLVSLIIMNHFSGNRG